MKNFNTKNNSDLSIYSNTNKNKYAFSTFKPQFTLNEKVITENDQIEEGCKTKTTISPPSPPQRFVQNTCYGNKTNNSNMYSLWRSKSFANGLPNGTRTYLDNLLNIPRISLRQEPITFADADTSAAAATSSILNQNDNFNQIINSSNNNNNNNTNINNNNVVNFRAKQSSNADDEKLVNKKDLNSVNNQISKRYSENLMPIKHSQSHHSYLSKEAPNSNDAQIKLNTTLTNSVTFHGQLSGVPGSMQTKKMDTISTSSIGSSGSGSLRGSGLVNDNYSSLTNLSTKRLLNALSLNSKNIRLPQSERSLVVFNSIEKGLRECICLTQEDISMIKKCIENGISLSSTQGKLYELEKQFKTAERYLKRVEFQLAKIEELRDQYETHIKLSNGVRIMVSAYSFSSGKEKDCALSSVRNQLKEYIQTMGLIEDELEQSMGTLLLQMQGIQGFARLCAGDVFEITIKCGEKQKWKIKGKILKDNLQSWDTTEKLFKPSLNEQLTIKAVELRGLGKKLCLGSKNCEIKNLFSARPQLMSVCLNATGTLKLHLIVTWNPLHDLKSNSNLINTSFNCNSLSGTSLTKSKSFTASSSSLFGKLRGNLTNPSSTYSTLNLNNSFNLNNRLFGTSNLNKRCTLPAGHGLMEILDVDYFNHPHLLNQKQTNTNQESSSQQPQVTVHALQTGQVPKVKLFNAKNKINNRYSYAGYNSSSLSPIMSPNLKVKETNYQEFKSNSNECRNSVKTNNADVTATEGITPTSTGSRGSSLHLTGTTTSSGFGSSGSSSSYCSSSMPNSALTSPDSELAPLEHKNQVNQINNNLINNNNNNANNINNNINNNNINNNNNNNNNNRQNMMLNSDLNNASPVQCDLYDCAHCGTINQKNSNKCNIKETKSTISKNKIVVEATIHQNPEQLNKKTFNTCDDQLKITSCKSLQSIEKQEDTVDCSKLDSCQENIENIQTSYNSPENTYNEIYFNVGDTLINLMSALEDIQGQYLELQNLQHNVLQLYKVLCQINKFKSMVCDLQASGQNNSFTSKDVKQLLSSSTCKKHSRRNSNGSDISFSVESALECFDFLNQATNTDSEVDSVGCTSDQRSSSSKVLNESDLKHKHSPEQHNSDAAKSLSNTPCITPSSFTQCTQHLSTGCEQIDITLMSHLTYCQRLIENLGAFGPLRRREKTSLNKLQAQEQAIHRLVRVCINLSEYLQVCVELHKDTKLKQSPNELALEMERLYIQFKQQQDLELTECYRSDSKIAKLWDLVCYLHTAKNTDEQLKAQINQMELGTKNSTTMNSTCSNITLGDTLLCVTSGGFALCLKQFIINNNLQSLTTTNTSSSMLNNFSMSMNNLVTSSNTSQTRHSNALLNLCTKVSELVTKRIIDAPHFDNDFVVSLFQLFIFMQNENSSLDHFFKAYTQEVQLLHSIQSNDAIELKNVLDKFKRTLPPKEPLMNISLLLFDQDPLIVRIAETYFLEAAKNRSMRNVILNQFLEALENDSADLRQAACLVIMLLNGDEYLQQLAFVCFADTEPNVRKQAQQTLLASGAEGRKLYENSQLFTHGFQGLTVR